MEDYQKRVVKEAVERAVEEAKELEKKLAALNEFLSVDCIFQSHGMTQQASDLLIEQSVHMTAYLGVLRKRLRMFHEMNESI